jgi:hypothetical protein
MQSGSAKVVVTVALLMFCLCAVYSFRFVAGEVSYLHTKLQPPVAPHSDVDSTSWVTTVSMLDAPSKVSQDAVRDVLGTRPNPAMSADAVAAQ